MFDMLTADQLFTLHSSLFDQGTAVHRRMIGPDGRPLLSVYGDDWAILSAWHAQIAEMQYEIGEELHRRAEEARAGA